MTNTTQPDTASLIAAIEAAIEHAQILSITEGTRTLADAGIFDREMKSNPMFNDAQKAFREFVTDYERQRSENERLRAFVDGFIDEQPQSQIGATDDWWANKWLEFAKEARALRAEGSGE